MATPRPSQPATAASSSLNPSATSGAASSASTNVASTAGSAASQHPQVTLLGTLPVVHIGALLQHITHHLTPLPPLPLFERETVLARHDNVASSIREKHDNAWAAVVRSRRAVRLRIRERTTPPRSATTDQHQHQHQEEVTCDMYLPLPPLPERQYPRVTVRPAVTVQVLAQRRLTTSLSSSTQPFASPYLPHPPSSLDTDPITGWRTLTSALGWTPSFAFIRYGLEFVLDDKSGLAPPSRSRAVPSPLHPTTDTLHFLRVYRIFRPDPTGFLSSADDNPDDDDETSARCEWVPLDPDGSTIIVELVSTVGGCLDPNHFTHASILASTPPPRAVNAGAAGVGADKEASLEHAIAHVEAVAKSLRGFVDLKREKVDF
ncbi:hypothetical protein ACQY0O_007417 [Thecaphora frezii]